MSIYATLLSFDSDADDPDGLRAPVVYRGSHVMPSGDDVRGGYVEVAGIPSFIYRDSAHPYPALQDWLRLSVGDHDEDQGRTVLLDRAHGERLRDTLTAWLERPADEEGE
jgi:hypothetical protein